MVSPWIEKGTLVHGPTGPTSNSEFDLTSIPATLKKIFGLKDFLTKRDAWAGTFEEILTHRTSPRTDCPTVLPPAPLVDPSYLQQEQNSPLNELQIDNIGYIEDALGEHFGDWSQMNQLQWGERMRKLMERFRGVN
eukprot:TRINITY_DN6546_c0_g1_i1.p1 TRINITY_DN6546_c0_g1~~TRINITY_DN6546_c0_g1_i1.p1  ORF type:complete len:136 (-),score=24.32 TRINITY_DN6546_c0_g1_i1:66-473(-)